MSLTTVLDIQFTASNGATSFTDVQGHTVGANNTPSIQNNKMTFNGTNQSIYVYDHADFAFTDDFIISGKFQASSLSGNRSLFEQYNFADYNDLISLTHNQSTGLRLLVKRAGTNIIDQSVGSPLSTGVEYLIQIERNGSNAYVKVNGTAVIAVSFAGNWPNPNGGLYWSYSFNPYNTSIYWAGTIDDIKIETGDIEDEEPIDPDPPTGDILFPSDESIWDLCTEIYYSKMAPGGPGWNSNGTYGDSAIYISSLHPQTLIDHPMSHYTQTNPDIVGYWQKIDVTRFGIAADAKFVEIGGELIISHQGTMPTGDLIVHFKRPLYINNNRIFHAMSSPQSGGDRKPCYCTVAVQDGYIDFAWYSNSPQFNSNYPTAGINLKIQKWGR